MAFSFRAGTNWCHDFPKLARDSGFYFNMHRTHTRVDWNRISTIDIDRVIRERDFFTIDDNINNVIDYHLETEYDVKILDPNFVKLFRLAQLSVEYLLYCKQYLDHSVIILKDELRSKLEENTKLKKELSMSENDMKELKEKFRHKYKFIEKRFSDSHGEIHKCPFCPKTFMAEVFMSLHITRRHPNSSQLSVTSPVHDQYKAEAEKLHDEIKTLKERLNEAERVIRTESIKLSDSVESSKDRYNNVRNGELERNEIIKDKRLEEENKKYRDDINHLTTMLFSEIRSLKQDDKKSDIQNELEYGNVKELLKQQENEIHRLREQLRQSSIKKSSSDMEIIQTKLNTQENFWQSKIDQLESQHRNDIDALYTQLKMTQATADSVRTDYINKINELEKSKAEHVKSTLTNLPSSNETNPVEISNQGIYNDGKHTVNSIINRNNAEEILIEDVDKISDVDVVIIPPPVSKVHRVTVSTIDSVDNSAHVKQNIERTNIHTLKPPRNNFQKPQNQWSEINDNRTDMKAKIKPNINSPQDNIDSKNRVENINNVTTDNKIAVSSTESDDSDSYSERISESKSSESNRSNRLDNTNDMTSNDEDTTEESQCKKQPQINIRLKSKDELKLEIQEALEQQLRDLGVDPDWQQIPSATYRKFIDTVRYHRSINSKKYPKFDNIRRNIIKQLADEVLIYQRKNGILIKDNPEKISRIKKSMIKVKSKSLKKLNAENNQNTHTPKLKSKIGTSFDISATNKFNIELLPKKINQSEFRDIKSSVTRPPLAQKSQINRDDNVNVSSPINNRYTSSPSRLNPKSMASIDAKYLSHSYESIKDYMKDNSEQRKINSSLNISKPMMSSTPQREYINISPSHKVTTASVTNRVPNFEEFTGALNSPKNNKSVLKSVTGSTGSLVKKKVLFDLQTTETSSDKTTEQRDFYTGKVQINDDDQSENESDFEISNISEENPGKSLTNVSTNSDNIILRTTQSEKIAEISRRIETQLTSIRHKPAGGIEAIFSNEVHVGNEKKFKGHQFDDTMGILENDIGELGMSVSATKRPQPTPRTPRPSYHPVSSDQKSDMKDINLEMEIEELLRED